MTTGMSAPPIGMISRKPMAKLERGDRPEDPRRLVLREVGDQAEDGDQRAEVDDVAQRQQDRLARSCCRSI